MIKIPEQVVSIVTFQGYMPRPSKEPEVVRFFNHPLIRGTAKCPCCGYLMTEHGWLDFPTHGQVVCPKMIVITFSGGAVRAFDNSLIKLLRAEELRDV